VDDQTECPRFIGVPCEKRKHIAPDDELNALGFACAVVMAVDDLFQAENAGGEGSDAKISEARRRLYQLVADWRGEGRPEALEVQNAALRIRVEDLELQVKILRRGLGCSSAVDCLGQPQEEGEEVC